VSVVEHREGNGMGWEGWEVGRDRPRRQVQHWGSDDAHRGGGVGDGEGWEDIESGRVDE
jgi:hypothetical protein